jgi:hypothetical protein
METALRHERLRIIYAAAVALLITSALIAASLYIILSGGYSPDTECWATTCIGALVGIWVTPTAQIFLTGTR